MKKNLLIVLLFATNSWAQVKAPVFSTPRLFVVTPTVAYNNEKQSKAVGVFLRGALVDNYEKVNYNYKITLDTGEIVFVTDTYNLKESLNAGDTYSKSPSVIVEDDGYYASPHLFTTVAGLKVRAKLNEEPATVVGTLLNGTVVPIQYYSYNPNAWVSIYVNNKKGFIPMKFVGQRPILDDLISEYKKASTPEDRKKYAERILELGWNSSPKETSKALKTYADFAQKNNQTAVAELSLLQANALEKAETSDNYTVITNLIAKKQFGFTFNNETEPKNGFKLATLEKFLGKQTKTITDLDDCGLADYESNVYFEKGECITHDINKTYTLRNMIMTHNNGFKINNTFINENTSEIEFLKITTGLVTYINPSDHTYYISLDDGSYEFLFKNGKLYKVSIFYYC